MAKTKMPSIEVFTDTNSKIRFRIRARNGEIVAQSEGYANKRNCRRGIEALADAMWHYEMENISIKYIEEPEQNVLLSGIELK